MIIKGKKEYIDSPGRSPSNILRDFSADLAAHKSSLHAEHLEEERKFEELRATLLNLCIQKIDSASLEDAISLKKHASMRC